MREPGNPQDYAKEPVDILSMLKWLFEADVMVGSELADDALDDVARNCAASAFLTPGHASREPSGRTPGRMPPMPRSSLWRSFEHGHGLGALFIDLKPATVKDEKLIALYTFHARCVAVALLCVVVAFPGTSLAMGTRGLESPWS